jgi:rRNA N6-adenosine-methyltransferase METTL5
MKLKQLSSILSQVKLFEDPDYELEQYPTSSLLASKMMFTAHNNFDDIEDRDVADFGCGTCMLSLAAAAMGAKSVTGFEIDESTISVAKENVESLELDVEIVHCDISEAGECILMEEDPPKKFDTIVMNPPFGTRTKGIDMEFLVKAIASCTRAVYSMHKTSTRLHVQKTAASCGALATVVATLRFDIPKMYVFHKEKSKDVEVDLWRVVPNADKTAIECALEKTISALRLEKKERAARERNRSKNKTNSGGGKSSKRGGRGGKSRRRR